MFFLKQNIAHFVVPSNSDGEMQENADVDKEDNSDTYGDFD